jgi:hypothetical protein
MRLLWHDIRAHSRASLFFAAWWTGLWVLTVATWHYDAAGMSSGMAQPFVFLHLLLPLLGTAVLASWRPDRAPGVLVLSGIAICAVDFAALLAWGQVLFALGRRVSPSRRPPAGLVEALGFFVIFAVIGLAAALLVLGVLRLRRRRRRGRG